MEVKNTKGYTLVEVITVMAIMGILGTMLVTMMNTGRQLYRNANAVMDAQSNARIAMSYITVKIRQNDVSDGISVNPFNVGSTQYWVLTIKDSVNLGYTYWIYSDGVPYPDVMGKCRPGKLREQYGNGDTVFDTDLKSGAEIADIGEFTIKQETDTTIDVEVESKPVNGTVGAHLTQTLTLRSEND